MRLPLSRLCHNLPDDCLITTRQTVAFNFARAHHIDVIELAAQATRLQVSAEHELRAALDCYRGDFLQGFQLPDAPAFEQWILARREHYRQLVLGAFTYLVQDARRKGDFTAGIDLARRVLALEPWHEESHRQLMWLLASNGQRSAALARYESCRRS